MYKRQGEENSLSSDTQGVVFVGYFQTPQITTMAGCIFSSPTEGKGLVVVNIFFGLVEPRLIHAAREFHEVSPLCCMCGAGLTYRCFLRGTCYSQKSHRPVICVGLCTHDYICAHGNYKYRRVLHKLNHKIIQTSV